MAPLLAGIVRVSFMGRRKAGADNFHADADQTRAMESYARQIGATVEFLPPELDVSGGDPIEKRPALKAAIEGVESGVYDGLIVAYLSRLSRSRSGIEIWARVEAAGGKVYSVAEQLDTSTPSGRFIRDIHLANAVREREEYIERFALRKLQATEAGIWQRRQTPTGYDRDPETRRLVPNDRVPEVQAAFAALAAGSPVVEVADRLRMTAQGTRYLLRSRVYLGELHEGDMVNPSAHPAIIDRDTFEAVQQILGSTPRRPRQPSKFDGPALLAGIVRCQSCGHTMTRTGGGNGRRPTAYACSGTRASGGGCRAPAAITLHLLDAHVEPLVRAELARLHVQAAARRRRGEDLRQALADAEHEIATYLEAVSAADVGAEAFGAGARQRRAAVEHARDALRREIALTPTNPGIDSGADALDQLDAQGRNALLRALLEVVIVRRAGGRGGGKGGYPTLDERVRVVAHGTGLPIRRKRGHDPIGISELPWPNLDDEGVLRMPSTEQPLELPRR